jgi:vacuolar-type H+-ATPase subunit H
MSQSSGRWIENAISALSEMEEEMDRIKERITEMKRELLSLAQKESERTKDEFTSQVTAWSEENLKAEREEIEKDAKKIIDKSEEEVKKLKIKMDKKFDQAVEIVTKAILGE